MISNNLVIACLVFVAEDGKYNIVNFVINNVDIVDMRNEALAIRRVVNNMVYCYSSENGTQFDRGFESDLDLALKEVSKLDYDTLYRIMEIIYGTQLGNKLLSYMDDDTRDSIELLIKLRR